MTFTCFVAGGSGGHIIPALTIARKLDSEIIFFATTKKIDRSLLQDKTFIKKTIFLPENKLPGKNPFKYPYFLYNLLVTFLRATFVLYKNKPDKLISTGGYISIPVSLAAKCLGIPVELYELNATPGRAAQVIGKFADKVYVPFKSCSSFFPSNGVIAPYPIKFSEQDRVYSRETILKTLNFSINKKTIFLMGGSQGSVFLNNQLKKFLLENKHLYPTIQVIHQVGGHGSGDPVSEWKTFYYNLGISAVIFGYSDNIKKFYQAADIIICRAGAGAMFEINFFNKKCLVIPHKSHATSHQASNALAMSETNPNFVCVKQDDIEKNNKLFSKKLHSFNI